MVWEKLSYIKQQDGKGGTPNPARIELQLSLQTSLAVFKADIVALYQDLSRDIEALWAETITSSQKLCVEDKIGKLGKDHADCRV